MECVLLQSPAAVQSLPDTNLQSMLKESIDRFLIEVQQQNADFSSFGSIFFRLLQCSADPPLEAIWSYSAISFHEVIRSKRGVLERVLAVKSLFQLLSACAASCGGSKSIALLAPAVSELYHCMKDEGSVSGKEKKMLRMEMESLLEGIVSYISICSGKMSGGGDSSCECLLPCFSDLVRLWTIHHSINGDGLRLLFPLVNDEIRSPLGDKGLSIGHLAGVVVTQAFLLRLTFKVLVSEAPRSDLQKELRIGAVSSLNAFHNSMFFDILLKLLLSPPLPVVSLANDDDQHLVRDVLYDVVILVDYSFINLDDSITSTLGRRLIVTHEAIRLARTAGDYKKAAGYLNAFSTSSIPSSLIRWVHKNIGLKKAGTPSSSTPQALITWFLNLEEKGITFFEGNIYKLCRNMIFEESKVVSESRILNTGSKTNNVVPFLFDNKGGTPEEKGENHMELVDSAFLSAARSMRSSPNNRKKRKDLANEESRSQGKLVKYRIDNNFGKDYSADAQSDSEVENPLSEQMEE